VIVVWCSSKRLGQIADEMMRRDAGQMRVTRTSIGTLSVMSVALLRLVVAYRGRLTPQAFGGVSGHPVDGRGYERWCEY